MRQLIGPRDKRLRRISQEILTIDGYVKALAAEMLQFIKSTQGKKLAAIGLAAPQFGELVQLFVVALPPHHGSLELVMINPKAVKEVGSHKVTESCLSLPGKEYLVSRPKLFKLKGLDLEGRPQAVKGHDLLAQVLRHEFDHLFGTLVEDMALRRIE